MADYEPIPESEIEEGNAGEPNDSAKLREVHERALTRFDSVAVPQQELRAQSLEARRFVTIPGAMWEGAWGEQFENSPRPEVDKITKSLEKIETDYKENRIVVDYVPANDSADEMTADTLDGMYRADAYHFKAMQAYDNAFQEAIRGGFGAWRLTTEYADPSDPDNDHQRVNPGMTIVDADQSVYFGPSALYDKSDAKWAFIVVAEAKAEAVAKWGDGNCTPFPSDQQKFTWDWFTPEVVRIAEYYEVEKCTETRITLTNPLTGVVDRFWESEIEPKELADRKAMGWKRTDRKGGKRDRIHKYILNGTCVLKDCGFIAGDCIPIVPVYGRRDYVDNMERWRGHVGKKMDRQRIYNSAIANVVETNSLSPREIPIVAPDQRTPEIDAEWSRANIDRLPYLQLMPLMDTDGKIVSAGPVGKISPPSVQPGTAALIQISSADLTDDDDNADQVKANTSVDAMDLAAARVDAKSGLYLDNMRQSMQRCAEIYQGQARDVCFEEGRTVDTLSDDDQDGTATLLEPHTDDQGVFRIRNDLSRGQYKVVATVQEATATKRQRTVRESLNVGEIAGKLGDQELGQAALLTAMMNMDGHGMQDLQKFARQKALAIGLAKPTAEEKQQIEQASQQQQEPSAAEKALLAQTEELTSKVGLNVAKTKESEATAELKRAQAEAVGGPEAAPDVPSGLDHPAHPNNIVSLMKDASTAELNTAKAEHLRHSMGHQTIKTGAELAQAEHQREMDRRAQDHAERTAA